MASIWTELKRRNVVRVAVAYAAVGWFLVEIASTVLPIFDAPHWTVQTFTFLIILGFPAAVALSWAFQVTADGIQKESDTDTSAAPASARRLDIVIIAVLVLALIYVGAGRDLLRPAERDDQQSGAELSEQASAPTERSPGADKNSIAVLAFADLSPDGDQQYFSDGISEQILNDLAQISDLQVTSRSSAFRFKGAGVDIPAVAAQLGVSSILEGSVRKSGNRIRITAQLINAENGFHLWSETYDRDLEDVFAVQDDISDAIVEALEKQFGLRANAAPRDIVARNPAAHEAYLRGRHLIVQATDASTEAAVREFQRAIELDPNYALAHAELAMAIIDMERPLEGLQHRSLAEIIAQSARHVEKAMELDPMLAEANAAAGLLAWRQSRYDETRSYLERALEINPNYVRVHLLLGNLLNYDLGEYADAFEMRSRAMRLDPLSISTVAFYLQALIERNRDEEAELELAKIAELYPHIHAYRLGSLRSRAGNLSNAIFGSLEALRINPGYSRPKGGLQFHFAAVGLNEEIFAFTDQPLSHALTLAGDAESAVRIANMWFADSPDERVVQHDLGLALAANGDYERARPLLEEMWVQSNGRIAKRRDLFRLESALALIAIRRAAGEEHRIGELVAAIQDNVRRYREAGIVGDGRSFGADYEEGMALYFSGDREAGLALIDRGTADGVVIPPGSAYLQRLYDDPGFAPILARQEKRQARERKIVLDIVCTNNPYEAVWQPRAGTCEGYAAAARN